MNAILITHLVLPAATIVATGLAVIWLKWTERRLAKDAARLRDAARMLNIHYDALATLVDDPATPPEMLELALDLSDVISDRESALKFLTFADKPAGAPDPETQDFWTSVVALKGHRPDLYKAFIDVIGTALASMAVRWPEGPTLLERNADKTLSSEKQEVVFAKTASKWSRMGGMAPAT